MKQQPTTDEEDFRRGMLKLMEQSKGCSVFLDWEDFVGVIATVQLSLRHPAYRGRTAVAMRRFCDGLIASIEADAPELARVLRLGYDPRADK